MQQTNSIPYRKCYDCVINEAGNDRCKKKKKNIIYIELFARRKHKKLFIPACLQRILK